MPNLRKIQRRLAEREGNKKQLLDKRISSIKSNPVAQGLFLDDERKPSDVTWIRYTANIEWLVVRTPDAFREAIRNKDFEVYSFDYYLGYDNLPTGLDLAKELEDKWRVTPPEDIPALYVHSQHEEGMKLLDRKMHSLYSLAYGEGPLED